MNVATARTEAAVLFRRFLIALVRIAVGARSEWLGCTPKPTRRIYFANHGSHIDTVAVMAGSMSDLPAATWRTAVTRSELRISLST